MGIIEENSEKATGGSVKSLLKIKRKDDGTDRKVDSCRAAFLWENEENPKRWTGEAPQQH